MRDERSPGRRRYTVGEYSLTFGLAAVACALIPVIGDLIAAPVAVIALVLGFIGIGRHDAGVAPKVLPAAIGAALGALSLFLVVLMLIVTTSG
jgi:hypothetical protein